jgi:hypothetical protein
MLHMPQLATPSLMKAMPAPAPTNGTILAPDLPAP